MASTDHTDAELRRAWRECAVVNLTFEQAMAIPAMATAVRLVADRNRRRAQRAEQHKHLDRKCAAANDVD